MQETLIVPTMAEMLAQGKQPEVLFWVGCSGSFDDRAKRITKAFVRILNRAKVEFCSIRHRRRLHRRSRKKSRKRILVSNASHDEYRGAKRL